MKLFLRIVTLIFLHAAFGQQYLIDSLRKALPEASDAQLQTLYFDLAWEYSYSNIDSGIYFTNLGLELVGNAENQRETFRFKSMLAMLYEISGKIEDATELFLEAAAYYEQNDIPIELSRTYNNMGVMFFNSGDMEKAKLYYQKSMDIDLSLGDSTGVFGSLINLAGVENKNGDYVAAYNFLKRSEKIAMAGDSEWSKSSVYEALGNNHLYRENYDSGLIYFEKVLPYFKADNDLYSTISTLNGILIAHASLGNHELAKKYVEENEQLLEGYDDISLKRKLYNVASDLYASTGDFRKAYDYQKKYEIATDSIANAERIRITNELEEKYQAGLREKEIAELEVDNQKSVNQRNIFILVSTMVVLGAIFLFFLVRSKSKTNTLITKSLSEKETLLREIHHRVKNNLQVISSLLSLQSRYIEDETAQEAVNEGQNRVKSMALIHQKLYQHDNLVGVEVLDYIQTLTSTLRSAYAVQPERVTVDYEIDDLNIDVDTIIPIGLILNELISNSFKHAFPGEKDGKVLIGLKEKDDGLELMVQDNGVGSDSDKSTADSFGMRMIKSLALKLEAEVNFDFSNGALARLVISNYKLV